MNPRSKPSRRLIRAAAIADATGTQAAPGAVLVEDERIIAAGTPQQIGDARASGTVAVEDHRHAIIIPALVNAHTHLDLTHLGPQPYTGDFIAWVDGVRAGRASTPDEIAASVREGARLSRAGGVAIVGDIAGVRSTVPTVALRASGVGGVSFFETFGVGRTQAAAIESTRLGTASIPATESGVRVGVQPHAPYSCGPEVYRAAAAIGVPLATHLAETPDEIRFVECGDGPIAEMLKRIGVWDDSILGTGRHPIDHVLDLLGDVMCLAAHANYVELQHIAALAQSNVSVAYCPRASAYFGHKDHRYREMLAAGVTVALGTDSILCLDVPDRISTLDEMRFLHRRDGTDAIDLLRMATTNGARALGIRESRVTLGPGESGGLIGVAIDSDAPRNAIDALSQALHRDDAPMWVLGPLTADNGWFK